MKSSLPAPRRSASAGDVSRTLTAAKENFKKGAQARPPLQSRKNVLHNWPERPLNRPRKSTIDTNNLKPLENQLPRSSVSTVKNRRFTTGSFNPNSIRKLDRKMEPKFKKAAQTEGSPLNSTFCLPCSDGKLARTKSSDVVVVQNCLPGTDATCSVPEAKLVPLANLPLTPVEPGDFTGLLTTPIMQECLEIAAQLSDEGKTCPVNALSQCPMSNVSVITEEPLPLDCSSSFYSDISLAKSPHVGCTLELPGDSLMDTSCQQIYTEVKCFELPSSDTLENEHSDCDSETVSFSGNLIQLDTEVQSDPKDLVGFVPCAPEAEGHSKNVNQSPAINNCCPSVGVKDLMILDVTMVQNDTPGTPSKNEFPDKSAKQTKPSSTSKLPLSMADLLLCEGSMLSDEILVVPQQDVCLGNEPAKLTNFAQSLAPGNLIQLNETMTLKGNRTFDASKPERSFGNDSNRLPSTGNKVQLNDTMTMDRKNTTFEALKYECNLGSDPKVTDMSLPIIGDKVQLNDTMTMDHKNTTFEALKYECNLGSNSNEAAGILPPTIDDQMQLINSMNVDQRNATFEELKYGDCFGGDVSKVTTSSFCKFTSEAVQQNGTVSDLKDARFEPTEVGNSLKMVEDGRTKELPGCEPHLPSGGLNDLEQRNSKSLKLVRKHEGSSLMSVSGQQGIKQNGESSHSKDSNATRNFGKDNSKCSARSELHQDNDGNISSAELEKGPPDLIKSIHLRDSMQNEELNVGENADLVHDAVSSEWAPHFMSTPNVAMRVSFLEYLPFDHSFQSSSSTLQDDAHSALADYPEKQVPKADLSSGSIKSDTKCTSGRVANAPRIEQKAKVLMTSSSKPASSLPAARRKAVNLAAVSQEDKCSAEKKSIPLPRRTTRLSSSSMGRGGKPPIQPSTLSKMCLPKPRQILGRPSSVGTGQSEASNQLPSVRTGVDTKMLAKAESQVTSRIPGIKRSPRAASKDPAQELKKSDSKPVQLFTMGVYDPPRSNRSAHKPPVLASKNIVTGMKRPGSVVGQKRQCPSPKRPKAVEVTAKVSKKGATKLLPPTESKQKEVKGVEKPAFESKVNMNKSSIMESESSQPQDMAKLQRKIKELEEKIIALELENAALRQKKGLSKDLEEHCHV
ncbi:uncharacterized protein LOC134353412 isoform X2 [Mobula hypostoma]|uniref:uncharacterized protein LOC134353412 isoform X2 n=1 Tax=Mobula hypostoma TaxID=723540 RepID=UPI002FC3365F